MAVTTKPTLAAFENADRLQQYFIRLERCIRINFSVQAVAFSDLRSSMMRPIRVSPQIRATAELRNGRVRCLAARLYWESRSPDCFSPLAAEALALEIISEGTRNASAAEKCGTPSWLLRAIELLHERLPANLTVERMAHEVGVHPVHMARVFRRCYGCSIGEYARKWRVEIATRQLATSASPIAEIAAAAGFADQSHLCRTFKAVSGLTPKEFRAIFCCR